MKLKKNKENEEFIRIENKEDVKLINSIEKAVCYNLIGFLKGEEEKFNRYGLSDIDIKDIETVVLDVFDDEGEFIVKTF